MERYKKREVKNIWRRKKTKVGQRERLKSVGKREIIWKGVGKERNRLLRKT